ncbi:MAG: hypothetical protein RSE91_04175 [Bacilli bacterium]
MKQSIWNINNKNNDFILEKDLKTDILIIGSGITGNTLAYLLDNKDITIIFLTDIPSATTPPKR